MVGVWFFLFVMNKVIDKLLLIKKKKTEKQSSWLAYKSIHTVLVKIYYQICKYTTKFSKDLQRIQQKNSHTDMPHKYVIWA